MKKIIFAALSVLMILSLVGCGSHIDYTENPVLGAGAIPGAFNGWDNTTAWTTVDDDKFVYTYEFTATDTSFTLTELSAATFYTVRVKALCSNGDESVWSTINFRSACEIVTEFPWIETLPFLRAITVVFLLFTHQTIPS